jgi:hypothetical protein
MTATLIRLCPHCAGKPHRLHAVPAGVDAVEWDAFIADGCGIREGQDRLQLAVDRGVSASALLVAQSARFGRITNNGPNGPEGSTR